MNAILCEAVPGCPDKGTRGQKSGKRVCTRHYQRMRRTGRYGSALANGIGDTKSACPRRVRANTRASAFQLVRLVSLVGEEWIIDPAKQSALVFRARRVSRSGKPTLIYKRRLSTWEARGWVSMYGADPLRARVTNKGQRAIKEARARAHEHPGAARRRSG